jgi:hypothetical protein
MQEEKEKEKEGKNGEGAQGGAAVVAEQATVEPSGGASP